MRHGRTHHKAGMMQAIVPALLAIGSAVFAYRAALFTYHLGFFIVRQIVAHVAYGRNLCGQWGRLAIDASLIIAAAICIGFIIGLCLPQSPLAANSVPPATHAAPIVRHDLPAATEI